MGAQEDAQRFAEMADELGLDDDDKQGFVNSAMKRKGYKPVTSWADPEPEQNESDEGDFFTNRKKAKEQKQQLQQQPPPQQKKASGWQYDD